MERALDLAREPPFRLGGLAVLPASLEVERDGVTEKLEPRAMEVLVTLVRAEGQVVSRDALIASCWGGRAVSDDAITRIVMRIRKLASGGGGADFTLETVTKVGYRLLRVATREAAPWAPGQMVLSTPAASTTAAARRPALATLLRGGRFPFVAAAASLALAVVLALLVTQLRRSSIDAPASPLAAREPSIAVLPFADLSEGGDQGYLADGLSEELMDRLARLDGLAVTGRTSSFAFKGRTEDLRAIGEALHVAHVLEGSVRRSGDRVRITVQLIDVKSGYHLSSQSYDREMGDVIATEDDIARDVAGALSLQLGDFHDVLRTTSDAEAYELVLRGQDLLRRRGAPESFLVAADLFRAAIARDPDYIVAWAGLGEALGFAQVFFIDRAPDTRRELDAVAERLTALRSDRGAYIRFQIAEARDDLGTMRAMLESVARSGSADLIAFMETSMSLKVGRPSAALGPLREIVRRDPLEPVASAILQAALYGAGDLEGAEAEYRRGLTLPGQAQIARVLAAAHGIFQALEAGYGKDVLDERGARLAAASTASIREGVTFNLTAVMDDRETALEDLRRELARFPDPGAMVPTSIAWYTDYFGDLDLAFEALRAQLGSGYAGPPWSGLFAPELAHVRADPRFKEILRERGYVDYWRTTGEWSEFCRPVGEDDFECR